MITVVVSVGTDHHPFARLLEWAADVERRLDAHVVVQCGATAPHPDLECFDYLPADELGERIRAADAVVCHGGPGTIGMCRSAGHRPIVIPRDPARGEHVDDHQMRYSAKLAADGDIDLAATCDELVAMLSQPRERIGDEDQPDGLRPADQFAELADRLLDGTIEPRPFRSRFLLRRTR